MAVWIKIGCALLGLLCTMFAYSSFIQLPALRADIALSLEQVNQRVSKVENDIITLRQQQDRLIAQRNADHPAKDTFR